MSDFLFDKNKQAHFRPSKKNIFFTSMYLHSVMYMYFNPYGFLKNLKTTNPFLNILFRLKYTSIKYILRGKMH